LSSNYPPPSENGASGERDRRFFPQTGAASGSSHVVSDSMDGLTESVLPGNQPRRLVARFPDLAGGLEPPPTEEVGYPSSQLGEVTAADESPDTGEAPPPGPKPRGRSALSVVREVVETLVLAVLIFLAVRAVVQNFKVEGSSMVPSFINGEYMLVNKAVYARIDMRTVHTFLPFISAGKEPMQYIFHGPQRGDVIVFHPPPSEGGDAKDFIKRVIGKPGDTVDVQNNVITVNGQAVEEPYIKQQTDCAGQYCHVQLGPDQYYVMGDNRGNSSDSRRWGPVQANKIIGKALLIYWCGAQCTHGWDKIGLAPNHSTQLAPKPEGQ
jgi:signal peptidase I